jgi:hypothetical protein
MTRYERYTAALAANTTTAPFQAWLAERIGAWLRHHGNHVPPKGWHYTEHAHALLFAHGADFDSWLEQNP